MIQPPRPHPQDQAQRYRERGWWKDKTFSQILEPRAL